MRMMASSTGSRVRARPAVPRTAQAIAPRRTSFGGGREVTRDGGYEFFELDDSVVNAEVSEVLRRFLPCVLPGRFGEDE